MYYVYMIRCQDNSLYTGITVDLNRRMQEHFQKEEKCAKYTYNHTAIKLETFWETKTRSLAAKLEYHIKRLSKTEKEYLIQDAKKLEDLLWHKVDCSQYKNKAQEATYKMKNVMK